MFVDEKQHGEAKPVQVGTLRLSTAIRIGAQKRPWIKDSWRGCALRAACDGVGERDAGHEIAQGHWPFLAQKASDLGWIDPRDGDKNYWGEGSFLISRLDAYGWPREKIADWIEAQGY